VQRKTQLVARRGELLAEAAEEQADATRGGEPLGLNGLPATALSTERAALSQAETYERWAADLETADVLSSRVALRLARQLRTVATEAARLRDDARDAMDAAGEEPTP
jgi:hypothetical protein